MQARQAVIVEPFKVGIRELELPDPAPNQILVRTEASAISPGTELAVYTGTHQWLLDPKLRQFRRFRHRSLSVFRYRSLVYYCHRTALVSHCIASSNKVH